MPIRTSFALAFGAVVLLGQSAAAQPRGVSGMHFEEHDQWTAADLLRHPRYERGRLVCETDYVRRRMMKTNVTVFPDGRFTLTTTNRGEAASRWVAQIQGEKVLRPVPPASPRRLNDIASTGSAIPLRGGLETMAPSRAKTIHA